VHVYWSIHPPGIAYPSDTNQAGLNELITTDYSYLGQILIFTNTGKVIWRFRPLGKDALNHPSLAVMLPNGYVLATDDRNDRVIVIDPKSDKIVWQYGRTGIPGSLPGYLNNPDGLDVAYPYSYLTRTLELYKNP